MAKRLQPQPKFAFDTSQAIFDAGTMQRVVVEAWDGYAVLRLKGSKVRFPVSWNAVYHLAAAQAAERERRAQNAQIGI